MNILQHGAKLKRVYHGTKFSEGPAVDADGKVYFTDCPNNRILVYDPATGKTKIWREPSGRANGMNFDAQGRLTACCDGANNGARAVVRFERDGSVTTLASHYNGKKLNAPNDLCFDRAGRIYFTDPRYGDRSGLEQDIMAVYRIELDGTLTRVIDDMETPNGILLSEDERTLYLVDHNPDPGGARTLLEYRADETGKWHRGRTLMDFAPGYGGDGMVMDVEGNIYLTACEGKKAGVYVCAPDGTLLEFIPTGETPGNCTFGGPDLRTLYIAASKSLYAVRTTLPGRLTFPKI